jgi:signal transduction histidine kinase
MYSTNLPLILTSLLNEHQDLLDKKQIKVNTTVPEKSNPIICDQNKIGQVMSSLLTSAIHHSPEDEVISIIMEEDASQPGIIISFQDHRTEPLPQEAIDNFDAYIDKKRIKTGGKTDGIKLAIAYKIVKYHNGSIKVQNLDQGGASCSITLPFNQPGNK